MIDEVAKEVAFRRCKLSDDLHVPIAARDEAAISNHDGEVVRTRSGGMSRKALLVSAAELPVRDTRLAIWNVEGADVLHRPFQVWVDVSYTRYRRAYRSAFPTEDVRGRVISHAMNRRVAVLKGFQFVRITSTSRGANSSSAFSEGRDVILHQNPGRMQASRNSGCFIQYADLTELMLMLDMNLGGGVMNAVNEAQKLVTPREQASA